MPGYQGEGSDPWMPQYREPPTAYHAFEHYLNLGWSRTTHRAYTQHVQECTRRRNGANRVSGTWSALSRKWKWVERVQAYEIHMAQVRARKNQRAVEAMQKRHATFGLMMQEAALKVLATMDPEEIPAHLIPKWLEVAVKLEREGRGIIEPGSTPNQSLASGQAAQSGPGVIEGEYVDLDAPILTDAERRASLEIARLRIAGASNGHDESRDVDNGEELASDLTGDDGPEADHS